MIIHRLRRVAWLALSLSLAVSGAEAALAAAEQPSRTLDLTGLTYVSSDDARSEMVLGAATARVLPEIEQVILGEVDLTLATIETGKSLELTCEHGELDLASGNFVGVGNVKGVTPDGRRFETERLYYDHEIGLVTSDAPVVIRDGKAAIRGGGLSYQVREGRLQLLGGAAVREEK
jgi:LPS export ABC transporter protein LptC